MRLIHQSCKPLIQEPGLDGIYKQIETAGRTCYKSLDKITPESAKPFVERMIKSNHTAMLEHGTVYLKIPYSAVDEEATKVSSCGKKYIIEHYGGNPYSIVHPNPSIMCDCVTTNLRVIAEHNLWNDLQYICEPTEYHEKRYTLLCTTALHCYKDLTRHRTMSFAIESTRYCNYSKTEKFGEMSFIIPTWCEIPEGNYPCHIDDNANFILEGTTFKELGISGANKLFIMNCGIVEHDYKTLIEYEWKAQQAAEVLPQCIKGDMVITGFARDWQHLLDLRYAGTTGAPHPMVKELAILMKEELEKQGFIYKEF